MSMKMKEKVGINSTQKKSTKENLEAWARSSESTYRDLQIDTPTRAKLEVRWPKLEHSEDTLLAENFDEDKVFLFHPAIHAA